mgnify:CR=1 FL=1
MESGSARVDPGLVVSANSSSSSSGAIPLATVNLVASLPPNRQLRHMTGGVLRKLC